MIGIIAGDIIGSRFEFAPYKSKDFELFGTGCRITDDSTMSIAIAHALLDCDGRADGLYERARKRMLEYGKRYPRVGYGARFLRWINSSDPQPYNSLGNGAAMRVGACGYAGRSLDKVILLSREVTRVTHNHPEGLKGAEATAAAIFIARDGNKSDVAKFISENYYDINFHVDDVRKDYKYDVTCMGTVPYALVCYLDSDSFEDAIRNAVSLGGDSDTLAAITGSVAEAYYGVPDSIRSAAMSYLDRDLTEILVRYENRFSNKNGRIF